MNNRSDVVVVGSLNLDLSVSVPTFPQAGETVFGTDLVRGGGGKGANQAVAVARLGRSVSMIGCVGDDDNGRLLVAGLTEQGVDCQLVRRSVDQPTGMAFIEVDSSGENRIVVIAGANAEVGSVDLNQAASQLADATVVLAQLEVPIETVNALAAMERTGRLVVNPAPALDGLDVTNIDLVVPNRGELAVLCATSVAQSIEEVAAQAQQISAAGCGVVVTLGSEGALVVDPVSAKFEHIEPVLVDVIDTTAAGDAFCGGLVDALCTGAELVEAARWANGVAALATTKRGAQASLPLRADIKS